MQTNLPANAKIQSHNLTLAEVTELQYKQVNNLPLDTMEASEDKNVKIFSHEKHLVHVELENPEFDRLTGEKKSVPFVQKFYVAEFNKMVKDGAFKGMKTRIVHMGEETAPVVAMQGTGAGSQGGGANANDNGNGGGPVKKELEKMNKLELQAEYKLLFQEDAKDELTKAELINLIQTKRDEAF